MERRNKTLMNSGMVKGVLPVYTLTFDPGFLTFSFRMYLASYLFPFTGNQSWLKLPNR